jgi:hypothetical protein
MNISNNPDAQRRLLQDSRIIAVVGYSPDASRTSYQIAQYLKRAGYTVIPVNPTVAEIDGDKCYASLADIPQPIDIVNVFRRAEHLPDVVTDAIHAGAKAVWAQLGIVHPDAEKRAEDGNTPIVMDVCIKVAHMQLAI